MEMLNQNIKLAQHRYWKRLQHSISGLDSPLWAECCHWLPCSVLAVQDRKGFAPARASTDPLLVYMCWEGVIYGQCCKSRRGLHAFAADGDGRRAFAMLVPLHPDRHAARHGAAHPAGRHPGTGQVGEAGTGGLTFVAVALARLVGQAILIRAGKPAPGLLSDHKA
ncbi:MAG: hypothetical protein Q4G25_10400 [Paracoccus sp. (in: a-proteobacteria)]|nr:hypothetical protein [Paracoccus sp. (in: a-proteobacteria)]